MPLIRCQRLIRSSPTRVEHRDARQQQELDERQVGAEQPGDAAEAGQQPGEVVDLADPALAPPQPHDHDRVGGDEHRHVPSGDPASLRARPACGLRGRWRRERAIGSLAMGRMAALVPEVLRTEAQFRLLFAGQVLSLVGDRVMLVALPFAVLEAGGSIEAVGLVVTAQLVPFLVFALAGGRHLRPRRPPSRAHRLRRRPPGRAGRRRRAARGRRRQPARRSGCWPRSTGRPTPSSSRPSPACCRRRSRTRASYSRPTRCAG